MSPMRVEYAQQLSASGARFRLLAGKCFGRRPRPAMKWSMDLAVVVADAWLASGALDPKQG